MKEPIIADKARFLGMGIAFLVVFVSKPYLLQWFSEYRMVAHIVIFLSISAALVLLLTLLGKKSSDRKAP